MIADPRLETPRPLTALRVRVGTRASLACIVLGSAIIRAIAAAAHAAPAYFPDEYIYTAISRSIGTHGRPLVRGAPAHFPALLEPLLAAPLWALASPVTAYHLVQIENAIFLSLGAVPVYLLARRLAFGPVYALASAAFAVAVPDVGWAGYMVADPLAYPLALAALYVGVVALQKPGRWVQLGFVTLTALVTFARIQYVVLAPAFVIAAVVIEHRAALRVYRWALGIFAAGGVAVLAVGLSRVLGYYSGLGTDLGTGLLKWFGLELFFFALAGGVVLLPGAAIGLGSARERRDRAFTALVVPFTLAVLFEGALYASNNPMPRFKERYLMVLLPLIPLAFGLYLRRGRPARVLVAAIAAAIAATAAMEPLSGYAAGAGFDDSPLLWCFTYVRWNLGISDSSLVFAAYATAGAAVAVAIAWRRLGRSAVGLALLVVVALSIGATRFDREYARQIRVHLAGVNPSWVDAAGVGPVAAIETDLAPTAALMQQLFWNTSITQELLLGDAAIPTDAFPTGKVVVARDGELTVDGRPLRTAFLFQGLNVTPAFEGVTRAGKDGTFTLWRAGRPRLRSLEIGRFEDGWLGPRGVLMVWPAGSPSGGTVSFTLSLPRSRPTPVKLRFGTGVYTLTPGQRLDVRIPIDGARPWSAPFIVVSGASVLPDQRPVTVRSTAPVFTAR